MRPKASWVGWICHTDQCFQRQRILCTSWTMDCGNIASETVHTFTKSPNWTLQSLTVTIWKVNSVTFDSFITGWSHVKSFLFFWGKGSYINGNLLDYITLSSTITILVFINFQLLPTALCIVSLSEHETVITVLEKVKWYSKPINLPGSWFDEAHLSQMMRLE